MICLFFRFGQILKFLHLLIARSPKNPMETLATPDGRRQFQGDTQLAAHIEEEIVHLRHALLPLGAGPASAATIQQALQAKAIAPVPSLRTIYRVLQRRAKEVTQPPSMP